MNKLVKVAPIKRFNFLQCSVSMYSERDELRNKSLQNERGSDGVHTLVSIGNDGSATEGTGG